jgi:hypothetical protein
LQIKTATQLTQPSAGGRHPGLPQSGSDQDRHTK